MKNKIKVLLCLCFAFAVTVFAANGKEFKISYVNSALNLPNMIEKDQKLFEKEFKKDGYSFQFPHYFSAPDQAKALISGDLDAANAVGAIAVIAALSNGADIKVISMYSRSPKAFFIMTKDPSITNIKSLKGKKIAGPQGTVLHEMLGAALTKNGMSLKDVQHLPMGIDLAFTAMESKTVDAVLLTGAAAQKAKASGARIIADGEGLIGGELVIAVSGKLYRDNPDFAKRLIKVHRQSLEYLKANPEKVYKLASKESGIPENAVKEMASYQDYDPQFSPVDIKNLKSTVKFLLDNKMIKKGIDVDLYFQNID